MGNLKKFTIERLNIKDWTLDENGLDHSIPLDNGRHILKCCNDLENLDCIPIEPLWQILNMIDLKSWTDFRRVNQRAMQVVDSIPQYRDIINHSPASLRGMLCIGISHLHTCLDLHLKLCTAECENCGDYGGYIYLLTCRRLCWLCLTEKLQYAPLSDVVIREYYSKDPGYIASLPFVESVPGLYANERKRSRRLPFVDAETAYQALLEHGLPRIEARALRAGERGLRRMALFRGNDLDCRNSSRFMMVVRAPSLESTNATPTWGFHCRGCRGQDTNRNMHWRRKFTLNRFEAHVQECGPLVHYKDEIYYHSGHDIR